MDSIVRRYAIRLSAVGALGLFAATAPAATTYRVLDLTPLGFEPTDWGTGFEDILAVNAMGAVVGSFMVDTDPGSGVTLKRHAFLWLPAPAYGLCEGLHDLHAEANGGLGLPEDESVAHDINDAGFVCGQAGGTIAGVGQAVVWVLSAGVKACHLGYLVSDPLQWTVARAINDDTPPLVVGDGIFLPL